VETGFPKRSCSNKKIEHDPEKWKPVFPRDKRYPFARRSRSNKKMAREDDSKKVSTLLARIKLSNDIRRDLVFDEGDAVAQLQLALLQPLQPQQIRRGRLMQGIDRRVEIAVLLLQPRKLGLQLALIFVGHDIR